MSPFYSREVWQSEAVSLPGLPAALSAVGYGQGVPFADATTDLGYFLANLLFGCGEGAQRRAAS